MSQKLFETITEHYLKLKARFKSMDSMVDIFSTLLQARCILICLPDKLEDFGVVRRFIPGVIQNFADAKITFLLRYNYINLLDRVERNRVELLTLKPENISTLGLADRQVINTVKKMNFQVAIDLNHEFNLVSAHLCFTSQAPLRICLMDVARDPFYNFQIQVNPQAQLDQKYEKLFKYISLKEVHLTPA
ncbi:hypothetical protein L0128_04980 [candidate division KSB1 bacterium]|nr:hypothetical protein [candidate division KSB1 bacterium]